MANLRLSHLVLYDRWPGAPNPHLGRPANGWDNTKDNFTTVATTDQPAYPVGTKIMAYTDNTNCPGWYTMMYLAYHSYCESGICITKDFSDGKFFCAHPKITDASTSQFADTSELPYYVVGSCVSGTTSDVTMGTPIAIPCADITEGDGTKAAAQGYGDSYGWFWVGGVCPCAEATILDDGSGNFKGVDLTVDGLLRAGPVFLCTTGSTGLLMSADETNATDLTSGIVTIPNPAAMALGWACVSAA